MITEGQKYTAYTINISGFALITPIGKIVLEPISTFSEFGLNGFLIYSVFCLILASIGIFLLLYGRGRLEVEIEKQ